jgi:hypothetical protein
MNALLTAALAYAVDLDLPVFPLKPRGKTPLTEHGFHDATIDPEQIRRWWQETPEANVGVATGQVVVIDLDVDRSPPGDQVWTRLCQEHDADALGTPWSVTRSHGYHLWYAPQAGVALRNSAGKIGPGIDVRANGGYVCAPPSTHPNGNPYYWVSAPRSLEGKIVAPLIGWYEESLAPLPRWVLDALAPKPVKGSRPAPARRRDEREDGVALRILQEEYERVASAEKGTRHATTYARSAAIGNLVAGGVLRVALAAEWLIDAAVKSGLPQDEAEKTVLDGLEMGMTTPRTLGGAR